MGLQEILNLIIACVPALTAILTVAGLTIKVLCGLKSLVRENKMNQEESAATIAELKLENQALQEQAKIMQKEVRQLTKHINLVVKKIDEGGLDEQETE